MKGKTGNKQLTLSFIDFQDLIISEKKTMLLTSKNRSELQKAKDYLFDFQDYVTLLHEMLEMSVQAGTEAESLSSIRDLIQHAFERVQLGRFRLSYLYQLGFILPLIAQIIVSHYGYAWLVIVCCVSCLITQALITSSEFRNFANREKPLSYFQDTQNQFDVAAIVFSVFYCLVRMSNPISAVVMADEAAEDYARHSALEKGMPLIHFIMIFLAFNQWLSYLQMVDVLNKYISLLGRALSDIVGFMILFLWLLLYFSLSFSVLGATFDDGGNYDDTYDTAHNDYPFLA